MKTVLGGFMKGGGGGVGGGCHHVRLKYIIILLKVLIYQYKSFSKCAELIPSDPGVTRNVDSHTNFIWFSQYCQKCPKYRFFLLLTS